MNTTSQATASEWATPYDMTKTNGIAMLSGHLFAVIACSFGPGGVVLNIMKFRAESFFSLASWLCFSFVLSSLILYALALGISKQPPERAKWMARLVLGIAIVCLLQSVTVLQPLVQCSDLYALGGAFFLLLTWWRTLPVSPYPGNVHYELGDTPAVFRVAANIVEGRGLLEDYYIGDFLGNKYHYTTRQPLLAYITSFFFRIMGVNPYSAHIYSQIAGAVVLLATASLPFALYPTPYGGDWLPVLCVLALGSIPAWALMNGLGAHTQPGAVPLLGLFVLQLGIGAENITAWLLGFLCIVYLWIFRPETQLLAILSLAGMLVVFVFAQPMGYMIAMVAGLACLLSPVWWKLPVIFEKLPPSFKNMIIFYLRHDDDIGAFFPSYTSIPQLVKSFNAFGLGNDTGLQAIASGNPAYAIKAHPVHFAFYLVREGLKLCKVVLLSYWRPTREAYAAMPIAPAVLFTVAILACSVGQPYWQWTHTVFVLYMATSILFNELWVRHILIVTPPVTVLFLCWFFQITNIHHLSAGLAVPICLCLLFTAMAHARFVMKERVRTENSGYEEIFKVLRPLVTEETVVMSRYPQLFAFALGGVNVGTIFAIEMLELYIAKFRPEFIVLDTVRGEDSFLRVFHNRFGEYVPGYETLASSPVWGIILRAVAKTGKKETREGHMS